MQLLFLISITEKRAVRPTFGAFGSLVARRYTRLSIHKKPISLSLSLPPRIPPSLADLKREADSEGGGLLLGRLGPHRQVVIGVIYHL